MSELCIVMMYLLWNGKDFTSEKKETEVVIGGGEEVKS